MRVPLANPEAERDWQAGIRAARRNSIVESAVMCTWLLVVLTGIFICASPLVVALVVLWIVSGILAICLGNG
jgi:hypothetical protein